MLRGTGPIPRTTDHSREIHEAKVPGKKPHDATEASP